jgi:uncharacterized protein (DUF486 family)
VVRKCFGKITKNASAVKIYNATISLARFGNKNIFYFYEKNAIAYYNAGVVIIKSIVVGSDSGVNPTTFEFTPTMPAL